MVLLRLPWYAGRLPPWQAPGPGCDPHRGHRLATAELAADRQPQSRHGNDRRRIQTRAGRSVLQRVDQKTIPQQLFPGFRGLSSRGRIVLLDVGVIRALTSLKAARPRISGMGEITPVGPDFRYLKRFMAQFREDIALRPCDRNAGAARRPGTSPRRKRWTPRFGPGLRSSRRDGFVPRAGEVAEWSKAHAWKVCRRGTVSRVRIPLSPPSVTAHISEIRPIRSTKRQYGAILATEAGAWESSG